MFDDSQKKYPYPSTSHELDASLRFRPKLKTAGVFVGSVGLSFLSIGLDASYNVASGIRNFSREHNLRKRAGRWARYLGDQALTAIGAKPESGEGTHIADPKSSADRFVEGGEHSTGSAIVADAQADNVAPVIDINSGRHIIQSGSGS